MKINESINPTRTQISIFWEKCFKEELCVRIPFDGKECVSANGCVRLYENNEEFHIELQLFGQTVSYKLSTGSICYPALEAGIGKIVACASDLELDERNRIKNVKLVVKLCIGTKIGGIDVKKCWNVYEDTISFFTYEELLASTNNTNNVGIDSLALANQMNAVGSKYSYIEKQSISSISSTEGEHIYEL